MFWYLFNSNKECYGRCDGEPDPEDLNTHGSCSKQYSENIDLEKYSVFLDENDQIKIIDKMEEDEEEMKFYENSLKV